MMQAPIKGPLLEDSKNVFNRHVSLINIRLHTGHLQLPKLRPRAQRHVQCALNNEHDDQCAASPQLGSPLRTAFAAAIVSSALLAASFPAHAGEWHARRHHRRIKDEVLEKAPKVAIPQRAKPATPPQDTRGVSSVQDGVSDLMSSAKRAYHKAKRAIEGDTVYSVGVSGRDAPATYYGKPQNSLDGSPLGWLAAAVAVGGVAFALWGRNIRWPWGGRGRKEGGKWVRDRSLGGKMIFIPDGSSNPSEPRPLWEDDDEFSSELADAAVTAASVLAVTQGQGTSQASSKAASDALKDAYPEWWAPPAPASYVSAQRKDELSRQAKAALRELEDAKILRGEDYSVSGMANLRRLCHQAGGVQVRPSTESGRDAILRAAVKAGIDATLRSSDPASSLGGYEPARFVSGLAIDLGVPEKRAITIVQAEVAATCRGALIDAEAAYRSGNQDDLLRALGRLVVTLSAFPLPRGSAEAELVGRSLLKQATLEFRRNVFLGAGSADLAIAPVVAEMLGFDPELVMPQLLTQMAAQNTQAQNDGETMGQSQ